MICHYLVMEYCRKFGVKDWIRWVDGVHVENLMLLNCKHNLHRLHGLIWLFWFPILQLHLFACV